MTLQPRSESRRHRLSDADAPDDAWARLAGALRPGTEWVLATVPVRPRRTRALWKHGEATTGVAPSMLWLEPAGAERSIALGTAGSPLEATGPGRAARITLGAEGLWRRVESLALPGRAPALPRLVGGFSFTPGPRCETLWRDFPDAAFHMPRWLYVERGDSATLTHAVHATELGPEAGVSSGPSLRQYAGSPWKRLITAAALVDSLPEDRDDVEPRRQTPVSRSAPDEGAWTERVDQLHGEFASGRLRKVVLARHTTLTLEEPVDIAWLIGRLQQESPGCCVFAVHRGATTFLGASPEWLLRLKGTRLETEALAGSCAADEDPSVLLGSAKDRTEHELVVSGLVDALSPLAACLSRPSEPEIIRLRHLLHLRTPVTAELRERHPPLELVERLHPTPAVGGDPTLPALAAIRQFEGSERGWYASPLGWFDAQGNARFIVGLRSGLVSSRTVRIFAGAGIMPDSKASLESREIRLKQRGFLRALGVEE